MGKALIHGMGVLCLLGLLCIPADLAGPTRRARRRQTQAKAPPAKPANLPEKPRSRRREQIPRQEGSDAGSFRLTGSFRLPGDLRRQRVSLSDANLLEFARAITPPKFDLDTYVTSS